MNIQSSDLNECKTAKVTPKVGESGHWVGKGQNECDICESGSVSQLQGCVK